MGVAHRSVAWSASICRKLEALDYGPDGGCWLPALLSNRASADAVVKSTLYIWRVEAKTGDSTGGWYPNRETETPEFQKLARGEARGSIAD